jgi:hypothetical protein
VLLCILYFVFHCYIRPSHFQFLLSIYHHSPTSVKNIPHLHRHLLQSNTDVSIKSSPFFCNIHWSKCRLFFSISTIIATSDGLTSGFYCLFFTINRFQSLTSSSSSCALIKHRRRRPNYQVVSSLSIFIDVSVAWLVIVMIADNLTSINHLLFIVALIQHVGSFKLSLF